MWSVYTLLVIINKGYHQCTCASVGARWRIRPGFSGMLVNLSFSRLAASTTGNPAAEVVDLTHEVGITVTRSWFLSFLNCGWVRSRHSWETGRGGPIWLVPWSPPWDDSTPRWCGRGPCGNHTAWTSSSFPLASCSWQANVPHSCPLWRSRSPSLERWEELNDPLRLSYSLSDLPGVSSCSSSSWLFLLPRSSFLSLMASSTSMLMHTFSTRSSRDTGWSFLIS